MNETVYTEEMGILSVEIFVNTTGTFESDLIVDLQIVETPVAGELFCHSHTVTLSNGCYLRISEESCMDTVAAMEADSLMLLSIWKKDSL